MKKLYELRDRLVDELTEYSDKEMTSGTLDVVDKIAHAVKNIDKIIECGDGYSSYNMSHKRDAMGRYSRGHSYKGDMVSELRGMMDDAPNERTRQEFQRFIQKLESM